jgi:hypothetical protein
MNLMMTRKQYGDTDGLCPRDFRGIAIERSHWLTRIIHGWEV